MTTSSSSARRTVLRPASFPRRASRFVACGRAGFDRARPWTLADLLGTDRCVDAHRVALARLPTGPTSSSASADTSRFRSASRPCCAAFRSCCTSRTRCPGWRTACSRDGPLPSGVTYGESAPLLAHPERVEVTGNPVRPAVLAADRRGPRCAFAPRRRHGAAGVRRQPRSAASQLRGRRTSGPPARDAGRLRVVHIAGKLEVETRPRRTRRRRRRRDGRWLVLDYVDDMGSALAAADLVVARAGATSIAEITALGLPGGARAVPVRDR